MIGWRLRKFCRTCKAAFPGSEKWGLQHVRRFAKPDQIRAHVLSSQALKRDSNRPLPAADNENVQRRYHDQSSAGSERNCECIWYFVGQVNDIQLESLHNLFSQSELLLGSENEAQIYIIDVPVTSPNSKEEATEWSDRYWPIVYKRVNPLGPHHSIVSNAEAEVSQRAEIWMSLARLVAHQSFEKKLGEDFGCAIVERNDEGKDRLVSLAGDLRYEAELLDTEEKETGNIFRHAAMRAIGMIARKRKSIGYDTVAEVPPAKKQWRNTLVENQYGHIYGDMPLTPLENYAYPAHFPSIDSYLCTGFEIYLTHEPCVMCSMAILHSRFGRCVFGKRMPMSGGLFAEPDHSVEEEHKYRHSGVSVTYGIFWRPELNSKFLCWQWYGEHENEKDERIMQA